MHARRKRHKKVNTILYVVIKIMFPNKIKQVEHNLFIIKVFFYRSCSSDESFVYIDFPPPQLVTTMSPESPVSQRTTPLTNDQLHDYMDEDGRLVQEHAFRKAVFLGVL